MMVTPYVGVWIETSVILDQSTSLRVTPYVGVWIETESNWEERRQSKSHPTWVCGLKHIAPDAPFPLHRHTLRGCVD